MINFPAWAQITSAALTIVIAMIVAWIGYLQWRTNELKRTQELFDRRYGLYKQALSFYEEFHSEQIGTSSSYEFHQLLTEAGFLFGPDIVDHLSNFSRHPKFDLSWFSQPFKKYLQLK